MSRSRPLGSATGSLTTTPISLMLPNGWSQLKVLVSAQSYGRTGQTYVAPGVASVNGITTFTEAGTPTGGTFNVKIFPLEFRGGYEAPGTGAVVVTADVAYNVSAAALKTAFVNTGYFATGDITAAGGALPTDITFTWTGVYAGNVPQIDVNSTGLTGGLNPNVVARTTTLPSPNGGYGYLEANAQEVWESDQGGNKNDRYIYLAAVTGTATYWITAYA